MPFFPIFTESFILLVKNAQKEEAVKIILSIYYIFTFGSQCRDVKDCFVKIPIASDWIQFYYTPIWQGDTV